MTTTFIVFHEVDDVEHWLASPRRAEAFRSIDASVRTFVDPDGSNRTGLIVDAPDADKFRELMASDEAAAAMRADGVRAETLVMLKES